MTLWQSTTRMFLLATAVLVTSCIDGREELWLEADGSGRAEITYTLPVAAARLHGGESGIREMITRFLKDTPEITSSICEVTSDEEQLQVRVRAVFDSALDLKSVSQGRAIHQLPNSASHLAGVVTADISGRTVDFSRSISAGKALPVASFLPAAQFEGHRLVYIMHLPVAATESNAIRVEDSGRTLVWDVPLGEALNSPIVTRFKMDIPIPWKLMSAVTLPLSLAGGFLLLRMRKARAAK